MQHRCIAIWIGVFCCGYERAQGITQRRSTATDGEKVMVRRFHSSHGKIAVGWNLSAKSDAANTKKVSSVSRTNSKSHDSTLLGINSLHNTSQRRLRRQHHKLTLQNVAEKNNEALIVQTAGEFNMVAVVLSVSLLIAFIWCYCCCCMATSGPTSEDAYWAIAQEEGKHLGFKPVQIGVFQFHVASDLEFENLASRIGGHILKFSTEKLLPTDQKIWLPLSDRSSKSWTHDTKVIQASWHTPSRTIIVALNHGVVGGGDYLGLGCEMFEGTSSSAMKPNFSCCMQFLAYARVGWFVRSFKQHVPLPTMIPNKTILQDEIPMASLPSTTGELKVATKTMLLFTIVSKLTKAIPDRRYFNCWLPLAIERADGNDPRNNLSLLCFTFDAHTETPQSLDKQLKSNMYQVPGFFFALKHASGQSHYHTSTSLKNHVDMVLTLSNITPSETWEVPLARADACLGSHMDRLPPMYPFYVWGLTMNGKCFVTYSVAATSFDFESFLSQNPNAKKLAANDAWKDLL